MRPSIPTRLASTAAGLLVLGGILAALACHQQMRAALLRHAGEEVLATVLDASALVDGALVQSPVPGAGDASADHHRIAALRRHLLRVKAAHRLTEPGSGVYTLRRAAASPQGAMVEAIAGTEVEPSGRQPSAAPRAAEAFQLAALEGRAGVSPVHHGPGGSWIAAAAPILDAAGDVVGALEADRNVDALLAEARRSALGIFVAGLIAAALGSFAAFRLGRGIERTHAAEMEAQAEQSERLLREAFRSRMGASVEAAAPPAAHARFAPSPAMPAAGQTPVANAAESAAAPLPGDSRAASEPSATAAAEVQEALAVTAPSAAHDGPIRALVVDDVPTNLKVLTRLLGRLGCHVDTASDGAEAVERYRSNAYDIILMDCMMPGVDGFEATVRIRALEPAGRHTPIVAVTANVSAEDRQRCISSGMDDHVPKPLKPGVMPEVLARWLPGREWKEPPREAA